MLRLNDVTDDLFRIAMETVSRMGVVTKTEASPKKLETESDVIVKTPKRNFYQSCYIVKINSVYYLANYKEIIGKEMTDNDHARTNTVAVLLDKWDIIKIADKKDIDKFGTQPTIFVIPYKAKHKYNFKGQIPNYKISKFISEYKEHNSEKIEEK
jgi:hypothetical protein